MAIAELVIYGDGSTGPLLPPADTCAVDVDRLVRQLVRFLKDFGSSGTKAAYARDLGVPYLVDQFGLDLVVTRLADGFDSPELLTACKGRKPSKRTAAADLCWLVMCINAGLDPFQDIEGEHVRTWVAAMHNRRKPDGQKALDTSAKARRVATVSSLYTWAVQEDLTESNPVDRLNRKRAGLLVDKHHSTTAGLTGEQLDMLVYAADHYGGNTGLRTPAVIALMASIGCRVQELIDLDTGDYFIDSGQRVVELTRKGGKKQRVPVPPVAAERIDAYLASRTDTSRELVRADQAGAGRSNVPLFASLPYRGSQGGGRLDRAEVREMLQRVAASHLELADVADSLHPHVLRHSVTTRLLAAGVPLHKVQELMGHVDPNTTQRYNRAIAILADSPAHEAGRMLAAGLAKLEGGAP